jgi:Na+-transporting methylmalonyl-CoA/oxaloacetate decarboxylase gamma subunit
MGLILLVLAVLVFSMGKIASAEGSYAPKPPQSDSFGKRERADVLEYVYREGNEPKDQGFQEVIPVSRNMPLSAESILCLSGIVVNERFLKEKGMQSVTIDQRSLISQFLSSIVEFLKFHWDFTDISRLHTQIVQRK